MEKGKAKIIGIIALIIVIIVGAIAIYANVFKNKDKNYKLETIAENEYKYFVVYTGGKYGVINTKGDMILENIYSEIKIPNPTKAVFIVSKEDGEKTVLNENREEIFKDLKNVSVIEIEGTVTNLPYEKSVLRYEENGKYGLLDFEGNIVTKAIYEEVASVKFKEGEILAKKNGKYGVINNKGVELIPFEYEEIEADKYYRNGNYQESGYIVKSTTQDGYRYGYINSAWEKLLETEYTEINRILDKDSKDVYIIAGKNGRYGVVKNKDVKIDYIYQSVEYNKEADLYAVQRTGKYGVLNIDAKTIVPVEYKNIKFNGLYILAETQTEGIYFNKNGEKVDNKYTGIIDAMDAKSYITIDSNDKYGIVNEKGEETVKNEYIYIEYAFNRYFVAYKEGQGLGVIDKDGNVVVDFKYDVLSKIDEYPLLKGKDMEKNTTTVFSKDMKEVVTLENSILRINNDIVEIFSKQAGVFVDQFGEIKEPKDVLTRKQIICII